MKNYLNNMGVNVIRSVRSYFRMISFFGVILLALAQPRRFFKEFNYRELLVHSYQYGPRLLPKITIFSVVISTVVTLITVRELTQYQSMAYAGTVLSTLVIREAGPLLISFFVIIYASVAIFDELEDIRLHLHNEATADSYEFFYKAILPRFFAIVFCMPILFFYFSLIAFVTVCFWINVGPEISLQTFLSQLNTIRTDHDVIIGLIKTCVFSGVNAFFACFYGMQHEPDPLHHSLPLIKSIYVNLGYLIFTDVFIEAIAIQLNY